MKRLLFISSAALISFPFLLSCERELEPEVSVPQEEVADLSEISASCYADTRVPQYATKSMDEWALIDQVTTRQLEANFLRIDEEVGADHVGMGTFYNSTPFKNASEAGSAGKVNWEKAYLAEATVISSPDNTEDIHYRSIIFSPKLAYNLLSNKRNDGTDDIDTTKFYHTRMVGWYPRNCQLMVKDGSQRYESSTAQNQTHKIGERVYKSVKFTGLDGSKDVMVSNVCEGQHWHSKLTQNSPYTAAADNLPYRAPFGHNLVYKEKTGTFVQQYSNFFKFRHYLSGVRFWGFVPEQNSHALDMWGNITDVYLLNQPTSVSITLPEEPLYDANANSLSWGAESAYMDNPEYWGQAYEWGDVANFSVQTGPMFGDDSNHSNEYYTVDFSKVNMKGVGDKEHALYLGYSLVRPDHTIEVEIHTKYGVYVTSINPRYTYQYYTGTGASKVEHTETIDLFKAGYYYDVYLSLKTDGTISAIIEKRGDEHYYDLTRSVQVDANTGSADDMVTSYQYSNCYIVDPTNDAYDIKDATGVEYPDGTADSAKDHICDYDGFFFSGMVPGNGDAGIFNYNSQKFYPSTANLNPAYAQLIWESSRLLISDVELINGYVKFKVPGISDSANYDASGNYKGTKGNAVIGVFDDDDKCLWSWHIWITDAPQTIVYEKTSGNKLYIMDRNLGATAASVVGGDVLATYGLYYQWGRKDPSMGPKTYNYSMEDTSTAPYYDYASDENTMSLPMSFPYPSLKNAVENPMYLILPTRKSDKGYDYDWIYQSPENLLWGHNLSTGTTSKTIYDPCPFGWRVSAGELDAVMSGSTGYSTSSTYGITYSTYIKTIGGDDTTLFFPFAGFKGKDKTNSVLATDWSYVGEKGDYQEALYNGSNDGLLYARRRMYISKASSWTERRIMGEATYTYGTNISPVNGSYVYKDWTNRRVAASVRCVRDAEFATVSTKITAQDNKTGFSAGEALNITFDALAAASLLTNVTVTESHKVNGETQVTELYNVNPNSPAWHMVYAFNAPEDDYLETTDGNYVFTLTGMSEYGVSSTYQLTLAYKKGNVISMPSPVQILAGQTYDLKAVTTLKYASGQTVTYSSSDASVVTVNATTGVVTGVGPGTATITATASAKDEWDAISNTSVFIVKQNAVITAPATMAIGVNQTSPIEATVNSGVTLSYVSSDPSKVSVDSYGYVTGLALCDNVAITISAPATGDYVAPEPVTVYVSVKNLKTRKLTLDAPDELEVNGSENTLAPGTYTLNATVSAGSGTVTYKVDDSSIASVNESTHVLTANACGTVTVTATVDSDGEYFGATATKTVKVYVYKNVTTIDGDGLYLITSSTSSSGYALGWQASSTTIQRRQLSSYASSVDSGVMTAPMYTIVLTATESDGSYTITQCKDSNRVLSYSNSLTFASGGTTTWTPGSNTLKVSSSSRYLRYNNGWSTTTNTWSSTTVYFWKRVCE